MRTQTVMGGLLSWGLVAATYGSVHVVTTLVDENDGPTAGTGLSLREAIDEACSDDTIVFDAALGGNTIVLTLGELAITSGLTIDGDVDGDNVADITLDANDASRIITFNGPNSRLRLQHLTLTNGEAGSAPGGAIAHNGGDLEVFRCNFYDNNAGSGGAIVKQTFVAPGRLMLAGCNFERNDANSGGAIGLFGGGPGTVADVIIDTCVFTDNTGSEGGAIFRNGNRLPWFTTVVTNSAFRTNDAIRGGAVFFFTESARFDRCVFETNDATSGGAFYALHDGDLVFDRCFFGFNFADSGSIQWGGALYLDALGGTVDFRQTAIVGNLAASRGAGLYIDGNPDSFRFSYSVLSENIFIRLDGTEQGWAIFNDGGAFSIEHSIIGQQSPGNLPYSAAIVGSFTSLGYNLFSETTVPNAIATDILGGSSGISGGPFAIEPAAGSDAIDAGDPTAVAGVDDVPLTDYFGKARVNGTIDIGLAEFGAAPVAGPVVSSIERINALITGLRKVDFVVVFDQPVDEVSAKDFTLTTTGSIRGAFVEAVEVGGVGIYIVRVDSGVGLGTLSLNVVDDDSIVGTDTRVPLGGFGLGNGNFLGSDMYQMLPRGDLDRDGDVDAIDWIAIDGCLAGPDIVVTDCACRSSDVDLDSDADIADLALLQQQF